MLNKLKYSIIIFSLLLTVGGVGFLCQNSPQVCVEEFNHFSYCSQKEGFLLEKNIMPSGIYKRKEKVKLNCQYCGKEFEVILSRRDTGKYCSKKCFGRAASQSMQEGGKRKPYWKNKKRSEETIDKISKTLTGRSLESIGHKKDCSCCGCKAKRGETKDKNGPNYKGGLPLCVECGKKIWYTSTRCYSCWSNYNQKENHAMYGKKHSKKAILKMKESHIGLDNHQLGRSMPEETKVKIRSRNEKLGVWIPLVQLKPYALYCRATNWKGKWSSNLSLRELKLLEEIGMFHPLKNPNGMVRDHMYSRYSGFKNNIPPILVRHPVNCHLITNSENLIKSSSNSITLKQLLKKIKKYKKGWLEQKSCLIVINKYKEKV